jgi:dienelactone hydrolase
MRLRARTQRRILAAAVGLIVVSLVLGVSLSNGGPARRQESFTRTGQTGAPSQRRIRKGASSRRGTAPMSPLRVASLALTLRESSSPAIATGHSASGAAFRALPTTVRFPVVGSGSTAPAGRPFPLVVFSQGFDESAQAYAGLLDAWTRAGYVVAAPTYPFTDPSSGAELNENDIVNHPRDLRFVITSLKWLARNPASPLHRVLDPTRVAIAGQSDGGDVTLAVAVNSCCRDPAVRAAIILSGAELASFGGTYYSASSVPLLVTQGSEDTINPPACSAQLYDSAPQPKYYLDIFGAEHLPPYVAPGPIRAGVERTTIAFLNAYLKRGTQGVGAIKTAARLPPQEELTSGSAAPPPSSTYCPGAP